MATRVEEVEETGEVSAVERWEAVREAAEAAEAVRLDEETRKKTNSTALSTISTIDRPGFETIHPARVSNEFELAARKEPKLLLEVVQTVLQQFNVYDEKMHSYITEATELNNEISKLNELNRLLLSAKGDDPVDLTNPKMKELLNDLKIELPNGSTVSGARAHFDSLKSTKNFLLNSIFTSKIQPSIQDKQMMAEIMRKIQDRYDQLMAQILKAQQV